MSIRKPPPVNVKDRIAALQQRSVSPPSQLAATPTASSSTKAIPPPVAGFRDRLAKFEGQGPVPAPRGSFGLGVPPAQGPQSTKSRELYGNRIPGYAGYARGASGPPLSRSGSPLPLGDESPPTPRMRRISTSELEGVGVQRELSPLQPQDTGVTTTSPRRSPTGNRRDSLVSQRRNSLILAMGGQVPPVDDSDASSDFIAQPSPIKPGATFPLSPHITGDSHLPFANSPAGTSSVDASPAAPSIVVSPDMAHSQLSSVEEMSPVVETTPDVPATSTEPASEELEKCPVSASPSHTTSERKIADDTEPSPEVAQSPPPETPSIVVSPSPTVAESAAIEEPLQSSLDDISTPAVPVVDLVVSKDGADMTEAAQLELEISAPDSAEASPSLTPPADHPTRPSHKRSLSIETEHSERSPPSALSVPYTAFRSPSQDQEAESPGDGAEDDAGAESRASVEMSLDEFAFENIPGDVDWRSAEGALAIETGLEGQESSVKSSSPETPLANGALESTTPASGSSSPYERDRSLTPTSPPASGSRSAYGASNSPATADMSLASSTMSYMSDISEGDLQLARRVSPSTSRAVPVVVPSASSSPHTPAHPDDEDDKDISYGSITIANGEKFHTTQTARARYKEPFLQPDFGAAKPSFSVVVHEKVVESNGMPQKRLPTTPQLNRVRRSIQAAQMRPPDSPGYADLANLLAEAAMLEERLMNGEIDAEDENGSSGSSGGHHDSHRSRTPVANGSAMRSQTKTPPPPPHDTPRHQLRAQVTPPGPRRVKSSYEPSSNRTYIDETPPPPPPPKSPAARYMAGARKLAARASSATTGAHSHSRSSTYEASEISSEDSVPVTTPPNNELGVPGFARGWPSLSPKKSVKSLGRAGSFADKLWQRRRTKSSVSSHGSHGSREHDADDLPPVPPPHVDSPPVPALHFSNLPPDPAVRHQQPKPSPTDRPVSWISESSHSSSNVSRSTADLSEDFLDAFPSVPQEVPFPTLHVPVHSKSHSSVSMAPNTRPHSHFAYQDESEPIQSELYLSRSNTLPLRPRKRSAGRT